MRGRKGEEMKEIGKNKWRKMRMSGEKTGTRKRGTFKNWKARVDVRGRE